jgi:hypothetical protein
MNLPRPSEGKIKIAVQLVAEVTERVGNASPSERTEWPYVPFTRNIAFPDFISLDMPVSKFLEPTFSASKPRLGEAEEIKALRAILGDDTSSLLDLSPQELLSKFEQENWENGSVVNLDRNSYYFHAPTTLNSASGEKLFYNLIVKRIGPHITVKQYLSNPSIESLLRETKHDTKTKAGPTETPKSVFGFISGPHLRSLLDCYALELADGHRFSTTMSRLTAHEQFKYIAALNTMILLADSGIDMHDILSVTFRKTGSGKAETDWACEIKLKSDSPDSQKTITIDVSAMDDRKYRPIPFPNN